MLLLADHVAELVERRHHVIAVLIALLTRPRHLQIFEHLLQFVEIGGACCATLDYYARNRTDESGELILQLAE